MRLAFTLGCRPSPDCMMPAFTSSSLNLPMSESSFSVGMTPASLFFVAFTITMTFMSYSLYTRPPGRQMGCSQGSRRSAGKFDSCAILFAEVHRQLLGEEVREHAHLAWRVLAGWPNYVQAGVGHRVLRQESHQRARGNVLVDEEVRQHRDAEAGK